MATEILSIGAENSAEFVVTVGVPVALILRGAGRAAIKIRASNGSYVTCDTLDTSDPVKVIDVAGTYIVSRLVDTAIEVDLEG